MEALSTSDRAFFWLQNRHKRFPVECFGTNLATQGRRRLDQNHRHPCDKSFGLCGEIHSLLKMGQLEQAVDVVLQMHEKGCSPSTAMYKSLFKACCKRKALAQAKRVHRCVCSAGVECTTYLGEFMVIALVKCGGFEDALQVFHRLPIKSVFSWTAIINRHYSNRHY